MIPIIKLPDGGETVILTNIVRTVENDNQTLTVYYSDGATVNYYGENMQVIQTVTNMNQILFDNYLRSAFTPENRIIQV